MCEEGGLSFVSFFDTNVVIPPSDIKFGEEGTAAELIHYFCDEWGHIVVLFGPLIDWVIVLHKS
jgi:hypothetical protein